MMRKLEPRTVDVKPTKIGHVDRVIVMLSHGVALPDKYKHESSTKPVQKRAARW